MGDHTPIKATYVSGADPVGRWLSKINELVGVPVTEGSKEDTELWHAFMRGASPTEAAKIVRQIRTLTPTADKE